MHIVLADDHSLFRQGFIKLLESKFEELTIYETANYADLLDGLAKWRDADLMLVDLYMPGMDDMTGLRLLRARAPKVPLVIISASTNRNDALACLEAGAVGYIPKTLSKERMFKALDTVLNRGIYLPIDDLDVMPDGAGDARAISSKPTVGPSELGLSPRQFEVLVLISQGFSNKQIAERLSLAEGTIKQHASALFRKMNAKSRTDAIAKASQLGLSV